MAAVVSIYGSGNKHIGSWIQLIGKAKLQLYSETLDILADERLSP